MKHDSNIQTKIEAAWEILQDPTLTRGNLNSLRKLIKGINPELDRKLKLTSDAWKKVDQIQKVKVIDLTIENLPDKTKKEKRRKKALLLLLKNYRQLKTEVKRVKKELEIQRSDGDKATKAQSVARMTGFAKGPFGVITAAAVVIGGGLLALKAVARDVNIINNGCSTLSPSSYNNISLPGLKLPAEPISSGETGMAQLPPLSFEVDMTNSSLVSVTAFNFDMSFNLGRSGAVVSFDGQTLNGKKTKVDLGSQKSHDLVIDCNTAK